MSRFFALFIILFSLTCFAETPVCVVSKKATLHAEPNSHSEITWVVPRFMPLMKLDRKGSWAQVQDVDGETHWVASSAISSKVPCAVIRTHTARLRQSAGASAPAAELSSVDKYTPFKRVGGDGEYIELQDDYGEKYWVADKYVWYPVFKMKIKF